MEFKKFGLNYVLRVDPSEEIVQTLLEFCGKQKVFFGTFNGIGACNKVELSTFDVEKKEYYNKTINGQLEITALIGNISKKDGKPYIHCHITLGDVKFNAFGGHLKSAIVSATCEITIIGIEGQIEREQSKETGLNIYKF